LDPLDEALARFDAVERAKQNEPLTLWSRPLSYEATEPEIGADFTKELIREMKSSPHLQPAVLLADGTLDSLIESLRRRVVSLGTLPPPTPTLGREYWNSYVVDVPHDGRRGLSIPRFSGVARAGWATRFQTLIRDTAEPAYSLSCEPWGRSMPKLVLFLTAREALYAPTAVREHSTLRTIEGAMAAANASELADSLAAHLRWLERQSPPTERR
jgi:hypothetical protein